MGRSVVVVCLFGANITSYTVGGKPVLFLSRSAVLDTTKPIRGGIPLVFPQFGPGAWPRRPRGLRRRLTPARRRVALARVRAHQHLVRRILRRL